MKRRISAIVFGVVISLSLFVGCTKATPSKGAGDGQKITDAEKKAVNGIVTYNMNLTKYEKGKKIRLWLPVAQTNEEQTIKDLKYDAAGAKTSLEKDKEGNEMLYVEWDENADPATRKVSCSFVVKRPEVLRPELKESGTIPADMSEFLKPTNMVVTDGNMKTLADGITKDKKNVLEKSRAIYDWVIANMNRDESVIGCGVGDVEKLLISKGGKCTDINSVFVGLCRAAGIPAREMFGVRMNADDITKNQHCWSQFYLPGTGWVYADPADVLKAVLKNKWTKDSKETKELQEYFWGSMDAKRVELSRGRDIVLTPAQAGEPLNNLGYPYAEIDGKDIDYYAPSNFIYTISFVKK